MKAKRAPETHPEIDHILHRKPGYLIRRLQQMAVSIFLEETAKFDITPVQYAALAAIAVYPGIDQIRLANAIGIDRTTISGVIDRMEIKALVRRRASSQDRRAKELQISPKGWKLLEDIEQATERVQERILEPLKMSRRMEFIGTLEELIRFHNSATRVPIDHALIAEQSARVRGAAPAARERYRPTSRKKAT